MDGVIPIDRAPGMPSPERDQKDSLGQVTAESLAKRTLEFHKEGLRARRLRDLTAEKYLLHVDGEGDAQWYDIYQGTRLNMTPSLNGVSPTQDNQLRPIVDNFVAHLTTQPYRFVVEFRPDRISRQTALVDQAIINAEVRSQKWNQLMAEAKYLASVAGFCPIHAMWRDSPESYEGVIGAVPGYVDTWVGNPFDTVFNPGARRNSIHRQTYGRTLPAELVRMAFGRPDLTGTSTMPSASAFQRVAQKWMTRAGMVHGHAELSSGKGTEELIALVYDEVLPGVDPMYPEGCLHIVALQGAGSTQSEEGRGSLGTPTLLWSGPLPASVLSSVNVYSHHRFDDVHGKPYIGDVDDDQVELNQRLSLMKDYLRKACKPPLGGSGAVTVDTVGYEGETFFEVDPQVGVSGMDLRYLEHPAAHLPFLIKDIESIYDRMYRKSGWQAASRGEQGAASGKAIIALQQADDSIMGPIAQRTREELEDLAVLTWRLRKEFMDVPGVLSYVGDELAHMAEPYVDRTMMSDRPPSFSLVSGFGTSTEARAQQLLNLVGVTDAAGEPLLTARQFRKQFPDNSLYAETDDPRDVKERRPRVVNEIIRRVADTKTQELQTQFPEWKPSMADPFTQQLGLIVEMEVAQVEDILMDDNVELCISTLSVITQDPTEDPVARRAAQQRQMRYFMWMAGQQKPAEEDAPAENKQQGQVQTQNGPRPVPGGQRNNTPQAAEAFNPAKQGGTVTAQSMVQADRSFSKQVGAA